MSDDPTARPGRIDFYDDANAPAATTIVPAVSAVVENDEGRILLIRRSDNGNWALPGGALDVGESLVQAVIREVEEETGVICEVRGVVGIYSDPRHVILYTSNDEVRQEFSVLFVGRNVGGRIRTSDESTRVEWVSRGDAVNITPMDQSMRGRLSDYLSWNGFTHVRPS
jgi:ADP-ribose pyrophosphatase YjhB (NUDIX family)